jgi:hypothetical protein
MSSLLVLLWVLTGGAVSIWVMMHIWLPDPPPNITGRFIGILLAGLVGGAVGGVLVHGLDVGSNPMPGIFGAITAGLILSGGWALLSGAGGKVAH